MNGMKMKGFFTVCALISMLFCIIVGLSVVVSKRIRKAHPSKLLAMMSFAEFFSCYHALVWRLNTVEVICYLGLHKVWQATSVVHAFTYNKN